MKFTLTYPKNSSTIFHTLKIEYSDRKEVIEMSSEYTSVFPDQRAPSGYGHHPKFERSYRKHRREMRKSYKEGRDYTGDRVLLTDIPKKGKVYLVPRDRYMTVIDEFGDIVAVGNMDKAMFPFSSCDFYADIFEEKYFKEFLNYAFYRLGGISQLGYLVPPRPEDWDKDVTISYLVPAFPHTRWVHSRLVPFICEAILATGFTENERLPMVLTAGYHDVAIPAGGDSVKRVDKEGLDEENNFQWLLEHHGLVQRWSEEYGFDINQARLWVKGHGLFGKILDIVDRMAYTALDCLYIGLNRPGEVRSFGLKNPLVMDVWQDLKINEDRSDFGFTDPDRLFNFLLFRAYEHAELLMNPYSRALDFFLQKMVQPLYQKGIITKEQLLTREDIWLHDVLRDCYPEKSVWAIIEPELLSWKKFDTLAQLEKFCSENEGTDHTEHIKGFDTGLNTGLYDGKRIVAAKEVFSREQKEELEELNRRVKGYYVYYAKE